MTLNMQNMEKPVMLMALKQQARQWMLQLENHFANSTQPWLGGAEPR